MTRPSFAPRRAHAPAKPAIDWQRVDYIAGLLAEGAVVAPWGSDGRLGLSLVGKVVATASPATVKAAREAKQEGML